MVWNGRHGKFNDMAVTSGKAGELEWESSKTAKHVPYKICDCDNVVSLSESLNKLKGEHLILSQYRKVTCGLCSQK